MGDHSTLAGSISEERRSRLNSLGFVWGPLEADWEEGFSYLKVYRDREGHCRVPQKYKERGYPLGQWVSVQRARQNALSDKRRQRLDDLGFIWDILEANWDEGFGYLRSYKDREGHCRVPTSHKENGFSLGRWVSFQRSQKDDLTAERRQKLNDLGFVWNKLEETWDKGYGYLTAYKEREGHCRVPRAHMENGFALDTWVNNQRKGQSVERRRRLEKLGFVLKRRP